ncbi:MAG: PRC-barrel domain-containing protein [Candidatus Micrarchaeia archaeon]
MDDIRLSSLYGKKIITTGGKNVGEVKDILLDLESGGVSHLLLMKLEHIAKSENIRQALAKSSVLYSKVKSVSASIIVGEN